MLRLPQFVLNQMNRDDSTEIRQQITTIASRFKMFECVECAQTIRRFLIESRISGKRIKLYTGSTEGYYGNIYHDGIQAVISTNGRHEGGEMGLVATEQEQEFEDFLGWIRKRFNVETNQSWASIVLFYSADENKALDTFFELFDEFLLQRKNLELEKQV